MLTHTRPWPPPGAGGLAAASVLLFFVTGAVAAAGLAAAELFGLNRSPSENLAGDGEGLIAVSAFLRLPFVFGAAAGDAAGLAGVVVSAFLPPRFAFGAPAGDSAGAGDAAVLLVPAVVSAFLLPRCFAGDAPGVGD